MSKTYTLEIDENGQHQIRTEDGQIFKRGDMVYQPDLPLWGPKKIKKFFYPEGNENIYVQFDEGFGSNDGCLPVSCISKNKPVKQ